MREDARKLGERNWRNAARNRDSWWKLQKKAVVPMMMMSYFIYADTYGDRLIVFSTECTCEFIATVFASFVTCLLLLLLLLRLRFFVDHLQARGSTDS
jgi:hypothetical protein